MKHTIYILTDRIAIDYILNGDIDELKEEFRKMGEDFSLGNKFNTSKVETMKSMFLSCSMPENFSLGDNFDTYMVKDMSGMFNSCSLPKSFSLGNKFDTSNVKIMSNMFKDCQMSDSFKEKYKDLI